MPQNYNVGCCTLTSAICSQRYKRRPLLSHHRRTSLRTWIAGATGGPRNHLNGNCGQGRVELRGSHCKPSGRKFRRYISRCSGKSRRGHFFTGENASAIKRKAPRASHYISLRVDPRRLHHVSCKKCFQSPAGLPGGLSNSHEHHLSARPSGLDSGLRRPLRCTNTTKKKKNQRADSLAHSRKDGSSILCPFSFTVCVFSCSRRERMVMPVKARICVPRILCCERWRKLDRVLPANATSQSLEIVRPQTCVELEVEFTARIARRAGNSTWLPRMGRRHDFRAGGSRCGRRFRGAWLFE